MLMPANLSAEVSCPVAVGPVATPDNTHDLQTTAQPSAHPSPSLVTVDSFPKAQGAMLRTNT